MLKATAALMTLALAGCIHAVAADSPKPPAPEFGYVKGLGANPEDFRSTSADCMARAKIVQSNGTDPNGFYRSCMRAEGWVEIPKRFLFPR